MTNNGNRRNVQYRDHTRAHAYTYTCVFFKWDVLPICKTYKYLRVPQRHRTASGKQQTCTDKSLQSHFFPQIKRLTARQCSIPRLRRSTRFTCLKIIICPGRSPPHPLQYLFASLPCTPKLANCNQITRKCCSNSSWINELSRTR